MSGSNCFVTRYPGLPILTVRRGCAILLGWTCSIQSRSHVQDNRRVELLQAGSNTKRAKGSPKSNHQHKTDKTLGAMQSNTTQKTVEAPSQPIFSPFLPFEAFLGLPEPRAWRGWSGASYPANEASTEYVYMSFRISHKILWISNKVKRFAR